MLSSSTNSAQNIRERLVLAFASAWVGLIGGYAAIGFREAFEALQAFAFGASLTRVHYNSLSPWVLILTPALGGLGVGYLIHKLSPARRVHGVSDVIESSADPDHPMNLRVGIVAATASMLSIGTGASVGREGPMVHLGATLGTWVASQLRIAPELARRLLACGVAAGVAASFNAPIAGAIFAAEVVVGHYTLHTFAPIVVASIAGTIASRTWYGDMHEFAVPALTIKSYVEIPSFVALGLLCAVAAILLIRCTELVNRTWGRVQVPTWCRAGLAGLLLGSIACVQPEVLGVGYETTSLALAGQFAITTALVLAAAKLFATGLCLGSGFAGGIFSPSLMVGALLGCAWGGAISALFPQFSSGESVYAIVGMGALAAATLGAPLSTTLIVLEMTGNYPVTLAVMLAAVGCSVVVNEIWGHSFFTWQLASRRSERLGQ